jgi:hypothetical protein
VCDFRRNRVGRSRPGSDYGNAGWTRGAPTSTAGSIPEQSDHAPTQTTRDCFGRRVQVSSGAHPRYARNPGTGEDQATATTLRAVDVEVLHGAGHPSLLVLPRGADAASAGAE